MYLLKLHGQTKDHLSIKMSDFCNPFVASFQGWILCSLNKPTPFHGACLVSLKHHCSDRDPQMPCTIQINRYMDNVNSCLLFISLSPWGVRVFFFWPVLSYLPVKCFDVCWCLAYKHQTIFFASWSEWCMCFLWSGYMGWLEVCWVQSTLEITHNIFQQP